MVQTPSGVVQTMYLLRMKGNDPTYFQMRGICCYQPLSYVTSSNLFFSLYHLYLFGVVQNHPKNSMQPRLSEVFGVVWTMCLFRRKRSSPTSEFLPLMQLYISKELYFVMDKILAISAFSKCGLMDAFTPIHPIGLYL